MPIYYDPRTAETYTVCRPLYNRLVAISYNPLQLPRY